MSRVLLGSEARRFGGAELYLERLARSLPGWEAAVAVPDRPGLAPWRARLAEAGVEVCGYAPSAAGWRRVAGRARSGADLVHVNLPATYDGGAGTLPAALALLSRRPVVTSEHLVHLPRSRRRSWWKRTLSAGVAGTLVATRAGKRALTAAGGSPSRIAVVPNGVPDPGGPFPLPPLDGGVVIRVLVTLEARKRVDLLLRVLVALPGVPLRLEVGGEGPERARLEALARELGVAGRVRFAGAVADGAAFLAGAHLVALSSRLEGMPLVVLDALACGRGVLVADLPGMDEVVDSSCGVLLPPEDLDAWTAAFREAEGERARIAEWGRGARARYDRDFTLARSAAGTARFYERVLAGTGEDG